MQEEYSRLISNLSVVDEPIRSNLIKATSATKTALESLDNTVLNDSVLTALDSFTKVIASVNDLVEELLSFTPPAPAPDPTPCPLPLPLPAGILDGDTQAE